MNTLKTTAARLSRLAPQGPLRWLKLTVYVFVFLLPFGMAILALLIYFERRNRVAATRVAALPAPGAKVAALVSDPISRKARRTRLSHYCGNES